MSKIWQKEIIQKGKYDPVWFIEEVLGDKLWHKQKEIAYAVKDNERVAIPASFGVGKTFLLARLALWWLYCLYPSKVVTLAPTLRQVKTLLWTEIRTAHAKAKYPLGGECLQLSLQVDPSDPEWFAIGFTADPNNIDKLTGFHSPNLMCLVDQAGGVSQSTFEGIEGFLTSENVRWVAASNTAISDCAFADICIPERKSKFGKWKIIPIAAYDSPNVVAGKNIFPGLARYDFVKEKEKQWGKDDPLYKIHIEAKFVLSSEMNVIPYQFIDHACYEEGEESDTIEIGLDVARMGLDSTVWVARSGTRALELKRSTGNDLMTVVGETIEYMRYLVEAYQKPISVIRIDTVGIGAGVYDRLNELEYPVEPVNNSERQSVVDKDRYFNIRAEMAWTLRYLFQQKEIGMAHLIQNLGFDMEAEFLSDLRVQKYKITSSGTIQLISKDDIRKELGRSPDFYDAFCLAFCSPGGGTPELEYYNPQKEILEAEYELQGMWDEIFERKNPKDVGFREVGRWQ